MPNIKSVRNHLFVRKLLEMAGKPQTEEAISYWSRRKEICYYQTYCRSHQRDRLSPGAPELLDRLKDEDIRINLCTASLIENIDFYFSYLGLGRWFDKRVIAYDDGSFPDKTAMYKACAERVGTDIRDCLVIEDSASAIRQAIAAGCENIVAIRNPETPQLPQIRQIVTDLREFDQRILEMFHVKHQETEDAYK